jgi:type I restriction enzyme, S subunit
MKLQRKPNLNATAPTSAWDEVPFDDAFDDVTSLASKIPQEAFLIRGRFPVIDQGDGFIAGYSNEESALWPDKLPVIIFGDHTRALKYVDFRFILGADGCKVLLPSEKIHPKFGYYHLKHLNISEAGYSRHFKFLKETSVRFPSLPEQRQIAQRLEQADRLRRTRRYALQLTDSFLPAAFLKLFGDPHTNTHKLPVEFLGDLCERVTVGFVGPMAEEYVSTGVPLLRSLNVRRNEIDRKDLKFVSDAFHQKLNKSKLSTGDVVSVRTGKPGVTAVIPPQLDDANCADLIVMTCGPKLVPVFLSESLNMILGDRDQIQGTTGAIQTHFNIERAKEVRIPLPPLPLQQNFAALVHRTDRLRAAQREALRQAGHLFAALLHHAFSSPS